ncbi:hypothetical protein [Enterococcus sp. N249-2]
MNITDYINRIDTFSISELPPNTDILLDSFENIDGVKAYIELSKHRDLHTYYLTIKSVSPLDNYGNFEYRNRSYQIHNNQSIENLLAKSDEYK